MSTSLTSFGAWAGAYNAAPDPDIWAAFARKPAVYFPEVVDSGGYKTTFYFQNLDSETAQVEIRTFKQDGTPWNVLPAGSVQTVFLGPLQSQIVETTASAGGVTAGWAEIESKDNLRIETTSLFQQSSGGVVVAEAGVFPSFPFSRALLPARRQGSVHDTGIAFSNPGTGSATITLRLRDQSGNQVGTTQVVTLAAKNQVAKFITEYFPGQVPASFEGSVEATTSTSTRVASWIDIFDFAFNTFAWVPGVRGDFPKESLFAQIVDSGGYKTTFRFVNLSSGITSSVNLRLFTPTGLPWTILPGNQSEFNATIPPNGAAFVQTTGSQAQAGVGWAIATNDDFVGTPELIQLFNGVAQVTSQAGMEPFPRLGAFRLFAKYDPATSVNTGIALANPNAVSITVTMRLYNTSGGAPVSTRQVTIAANGQMSMHLDQWFPGIGAVTGIVDGIVDSPQTSLGVTVSSLQANASQLANFPVIF